MNVLILEDDMRIQKAYVRMFNQTGHNVVVVSSPKEALEKLKHFTPDIVFSDWDMPGMTGGDFILEARAKGAKFPIIIVSGTWRGGEAPHASECLMKPLSRSELIAAIDRHTKK